MNTYQKHLAAIHAGTITKTNVIGIRKGLAHADRLRAGWSGNRSNITPEQADALETSLAACRPLVSGDLHATGLALLRSRRYAKRFSDEQRAIIAAPDVRFQLLRYDRAEIDRHRTAIVPVYRVATLRGSFAFRNIPWQSGGNGPEIVTERTA